MPTRSFDEANRFQRTVRTLGVTKVARVLFRPTAHRLDRLVSRLTGGRRSLSGVGAGLSMVILTTTGAKSGRARTVALLGIAHPDGVAVVASNFGGALHPGWYHNLRANPVATVTMEGQAWSATARLAGPDERDAIWERGVKIFPGLTKEQARAGDRRIEAFVLVRH